MARLARSEDWALALRSAMGERRLLLIIDDVRNLDDALALEERR